SSASSWRRTRAAARCPPASCRRSEVDDLPAAAAAGGPPFPHQKALMQLNFDIGLAERLNTAAAARKARLAGFKPKPSRAAPHPVDYAGQRAAELDRVREARAQAKTAKR